MLLSWSFSSCNSSCFQCSIIFSLFTTSYILLTWTIQLCFSSFHWVLYYIFLIFYELRHKWARHIGSCSLCCILTEWGWVVRSSCWQHCTCAFDRWARDQREVRRQGVMQSGLFVFHKNLNSNSKFYCVARRVRHRMISRFHCFRRLGIFHEFRLKFLPFFSQHCQYLQHQANWILSADRVPWLI